MVLGCEGIVLGVGGIGTTLYLYDSKVAGGFRGGSGM